MNYNEICDYRFWIGGCSDIGTLKLIDCVMLVGYGLVILVLAFYLINRRFIKKSSFRPVDKMTQSCIVALTLKVINVSLIVLQVPVPQISYIADGLAMMSISTLFGQFRGILIFVVGKGVQNFTLDKEKKTEAIWLRILKMYLKLIKIPIIAFLLWLTFAPDYNQYKIARMTYYYLTGTALLLNIVLLLKLHDDIISALGQAQLILKQSKNKSSIKKKKTSPEKEENTDSDRQDSTTASKETNKKQLTSNNNNTRQRTREDRIAWLSNVIRLYVLIMCVYGGLENLKTAITMDMFAGNIYYDSICTVLYHGQILAGTIFMLYIAVGNQ